jgi:hypothetical protein
MAVSDFSAIDNIGALHEADIHRGLVTGLVSAPFIINNFVSPEIAQRILPDW